MVEGDKNKTLIMGIAAGCALIGAALIYHFVFADEEEEVAAGNLIADLEAAGLDKVKKAPNGSMLDPQYLCKLLNFTTVTARKRNEEERKQLIEQRRACYKNEQWNDYRDIVQQIFQKDDQMCQVVIKEIFEILTETNEQEFQATMGMMAQHPQFAQVLMAAQQGKLPDENAVAAAKDKPKLEKSKVLKAFEVSKALTMEAMKKQAKAQSAPPKDEMEMMIDMFADQAKIEDALFIKEQVSNEDLEDSLMYYMNKQDPDITKVMTAYMTEMQSEMRKLGGGMPGMPGM